MNKLIFDDNGKCITEYGVYELYPTYGDRYAANFKPNPIETSPSQEVSREEAYFDLETTIKVIEDHYHMMKIRKERTNWK